MPNEAVIHTCYCIEGIIEGTILGIIGVLFEKEHKMASEKQDRADALMRLLLAYTPAIEGPYIALLVDLE